MANERPATDQSFYDRISHAYDLIANAGEHKARESGEAALGVQEGERLLELGFGTGNSILNLANAVGSTGHVTGVDISPGMLDVARKKLEQKGLQDRVELQVGDGRNLPVGDAAFDAAFTSFTLELFDLQDIPTVLKEFHRALKPGGRLGVVSMATVAEGEKASALEKTYIWMHQHFPHIVDCQPIDVVKWVSEGGFKISKVVEMEIWSMPVRGVIATKA